MICLLCARSMSSLSSQCQMAQYRSSVSDKISLMMLEAVWSPHIGWRAPSPRSVVMLTNCYDYCHCTLIVGDGVATLYERLGRGRIRVGGWGKGTLLEYVLSVEKSL